MKKFEKPIMNISLFEMENVVTTSGQDKVQAMDQAKAALTSKGINLDTQTFTFTF